MKKYMVLYTGTEDSWEKMKDATPEDMKKGMELWMDWAKKCGEHLVDMGSPLANGETMSKENSSKSQKGLMGYSVLQAEDMGSVKKFLENHPHLSWADGCEIEVYECKEMKH